MVASDAHSKAPYTYFSLAFGLIFSVNTHCPCSVPFLCTHLKSRLFELLQRQAEVGCFQLCTWFIFSFLLLLALPMPPPLLARTEMYTVRLDQQSVYLRIIDNLHLLIICLNTELCTHRKQRYRRTYHC